MLNIRIQPITVWQGQETKSPGYSRFKAGYKHTIAQLERELEKAGTVMSSIVMQMWVKPEQIVIDGTRLRADARPYKPGIILSFTRKTKNSQSEDVNFPCDTFNNWQDNLRGITLSLEALRAVERYGVFRYEQLVSRLGLLSAEGKHDSFEEAAQFIYEHSQGYALEGILDDSEIRKAAYRAAANKLHPDKGGNHEDFAKLITANNLLCGTTNALSAGGEKVSRGLETAAGIVRERDAVRRNRLHP